MIHKLGNIIIHSENNKIHRLDGPAVLTETTQEWYKNVLFHRSDGPARMFKQTPDGKKFVAEFWLNGEFIMSDEIIDMEQWDKWWSKE